MKELLKVVYRRDIVFENIHPDNVIMDHTATENNEKVMKIIIHFVERSLKEWILLFPQKEEELKQYAREKAMVRQRDRR